MALSHVKIKWTKSDTPWVCRVEYYRPKTTWKRYRGQDTKCEKPNYAIYDPCYALSPVITGEFPISGTTTGMQKYNSGDGDPANWCGSQNALYAVYGGIAAQPCYNEPSFYEYNNFRTRAADDIILKRSQNIWTWYADPALAVDYENVIGLKAKFLYHFNNHYIPYSQSICNITGMGFDITVTCRCDIYFGGYMTYPWHTNYGFSPEAAQTYTLTTSPKDWLVPKNPHWCETVQHRYQIYHHVTYYSSAALILGEKNTWEGSWDPPLEGEYMLGVKNEAGEFFPICPIVDS